MTKNPKISKSLQQSLCSNVVTSDRPVVLLLLRISREYKTVPNFRIVFRAALFGVWTQCL